MRYVFFQRFQLLCPCLNAVVLLPFSLTLALLWEKRIRHTGKSLTCCFLRESHSGGSVQLVAMAVSFYTPKVKTSCEHRAEESMKISAPIGVPLLPRTCPVLCLDR